jgi:hypothetical protein
MTSECTPTCLCLQAREGIFPSFVGLVLEWMIQVASTPNVGDRGTDARRFRSTIYAFVLERIEHLFHYLDLFFSHICSFLMSD